MLPTRSHFEQSFVTVATDQEIFSGKGGCRGRFLLAGCHWSISEMTDLKVSWTFLSCVEDWVLRHEVVCSVCCYCSNTIDFVSDLCPCVVSFGCNTWIHIYICYTWFADRHCACVDVVSGILCRLCYTHIDRTYVSFLYGFLRGWPGPLFAWNFVHILLPCIHVFWFLCSCAWFYVSSDHFRKDTPYCICHK